MTSPTSLDPAIQSAAKWFWWIAGLSLVNTALYYAGSDTSFVMGLAMTTLSSVMFASHVPLAVGLAGLTIGFYVLVGLQAQREKAWAFYCGLATYVVDALIYARFEDWMSVGFHVFAIYSISKGVMRLRELACAPVPSSPSVA